MLSRVTIIISSYQEVVGIVFMHEVVIVSLPSVIMWVRGVFRKTVVAYLSSSHLQSQVTSQMITFMPLVVVLIAQVDYC